MKLFIILLLIQLSCIRSSIDTKTEITCISDKKEVKSTTCIGYKNGISCRATTDTSNITINDLIIPGDMVCYCNVISYFKSNNKVYYESNSWRLVERCIGSK